MAQRNAKTVDDDDYKEVFRCSGGHNAHTSAARALPAGARETAATLGLTKLGGYLACLRVMNHRRDIKPPSYIATKIINFVSR